MVELVYKEEAYKIIGACMEVHRLLGKGHSENIYKDALEIEFQIQEIPYLREQGFIVEYKGKVLRHHYFADFVVDDKIILEAKAIGMLSLGNTRQTLNYLAASKFKLRLLVNFGEDSLKYARVIL